MKDQLSFKELITILLITISMLLAHSVRADVVEDTMDLGRADHRMHFGISMGFSLALSETFRAAKIKNPEGLAAVTVISLGLIKELADPQFSAGDLQADFLGALTGSFLSYTIHF